MRIQRLLPPAHRQSGYTLIELLLYVAMVGGLLTSVIFFYSTTIDARVKNQSIVEVNDQGAALMDYITQTIRNATSITSPTTGASATSLTLAVPTGSLSPTVFSLSGSSNLGYTTIGGSTDAGDSGSINATKFTASTTGTVSTLYAYVGATVSASPNNVGQMAIYSGTSSAPTALLASSSSTALAANSWNAFSIASTAVTSGQIYWLAYNTNGSGTSANNLKFDTTGAVQSIYKTQTFGSWPSSWTGTTQNLQFSMYAPITTGTPAALQVQEGSGGVVALNNDLVTVSGLAFKNLTRASTPGSVQVTFTVSRVNPNGKNEFDYQRTFTDTAEVTW